MANLEAFYAAFQEKFRGSYEDIQLRLRAYLPECERVGAGSWNGLILDLGSGRGEWLDLLKEGSLNAEGVDSHPRLGQEARTRGLLVHTGDALDHLKNAKDNTYGAITAFHLIEHIEWASQLTLLEHCYRALRPNGIIIFEWPNIEDIRVATRSFWLDPTHMRPLPHQLLGFMAEFTGFRSLRLLRFRPHPVAAPVKTGDGVPIVKNLVLKQWMTDMSRTLDEFISPGADIALIGQKSEAVRERSSQI